MCTDKALINVFAAQRHSIPASQVARVFSVSRSALVRLERSAPVSASDLQRLLASQSVSQPTPTGQGDSQ